MERMHKALNEYPDLKSFLSVGGTLDTSGDLNATIAMLNAIEEKVEHVQSAHKRVTDVIEQDDEPSQ